MRAKDFVVLGILFWWLLKDREETAVSLTQTCVDSEGNLITVPLGDCPPGYELVTGEVYPTEPLTGVEGGPNPPCNCFREPCNC